MAAEKALRTGIPRHHNSVGMFIGKSISYIVFVLWTLITILPLVWMLYSSFKTNEELTLNVFSLPDAMIRNQDHEFIVIQRTLNVVLDYDESTDTRERIIIESTSIAPTRRLMVYFLVKADMPPEIQALQPGDRIDLRDLPRAERTRIGWDMIWWNYSSAFTRGTLGPKFINSVIYAGCGTGLVILLGLMISFACAKLKFPKLSAIVGGLIGLGYLIAINSVIIPLFLMLRAVGLTDNHFGIILVYTAFGLPMAVLLGTQFIRGLPDSLIESGYIDGASTMRIFLSVIIPMTVPVIVTISIMSALGIWNEFLLVLVLGSSESTKSLPVGVFSFSSLTSQQLGWQLAALIIAVVPAMTVYFIFSKQLAQGVVGGAVKG